MKVLLINPHDTDQGGYSSPPIGLAYLAAVLIKHNIEVQIIDGYLVGFRKIQNKVKEFTPDIVGITCYTPGRHNALQIAKYAKSFNSSIITILGGAHPTIMWKQIMENYPFVDMCVLGEGENTLLEICNGLELLKIDGLVWRNNEEIINNKSSHYIANLNEIPFPAWELLDITKYPERGVGVFNGIDISKTPRIPLIFSRGCTGKCNFCSTWWIWKGHRSRSAKNMADEIKYLVRKFDVRHFCFYDDAFSVDIIATKELCREIIQRGLKITWFATTRVDCVDDELLQLMKQAGCYELSFGIESGSQKILDLMKKEVDLRQANNAIFKTKLSGIIATALLIIGNVGEDNKTINETVYFLRKTKPDKICFTGNLWVLPGTTLYQQMKKGGFINDSFWLSENPYFIYPKHTKREISKYIDAISSTTKIGSFSFFINHNKEIKSFINKIKTFRFYFKPRRIVAQYKLFFGDEWLELSVDSIANYVHKVLFAVSDIPWGADTSIKGDNLEPIIERLKAKYGDKIIVCKGSWNKQLEHVQAGLDYIKKNIPEATHCLYIDSDEVYKPRQIKALSLLIGKRKYFNRAIRINYNTYFKSIYYKIVPEKWPTALVVFPVRDYINYYDARNVTAGIIDLPNYYYEHFAYVRKNDEQIWKKIAAHQETEPILEDWYNEVWLKWTTKMRNFHPTNYEFWEGVVKVDDSELPSVVIEIYNKWQIK